MLLRVAYNEDALFSSIYIIYIVVTPKNPSCCVRHCTNIEESFRNIMHLP